MEHIKSTVEKVREFKNKYYTNLLMKGAIFLVSFVLSVFLIINYLEFFLHLNKTFRAVLFFTFVLVFVVSLYSFILQPLFYLLKLKPQISDEDAAVIIGQKLTGINDKLLNTVQLFKASSANSLASASIGQRELLFQDITFSSSINFKENLRFVKFLIPPLLIVLFVILFFPSSLLESSSRIINYNRHYENAPFTFLIENNDLRAFRNEDFSLKVNLKGRAFPQDVYVNVDGRKYKMEKGEGTAFTYTFKNIQKDEFFTVEAAGFYSEEHKISVLNRPGLFDLSIVLNFPDYLKRKSEVINNAGSVNIPEGTTMTWNFNTNYTDKVVLNINNKILEASKTGENKYVYSKIIKENSTIGIKLKNEVTTSKEDLSYNINVIKDQYPKVELTVVPDTVLFSNVILGGSLSDDYGLLALQLYYKIEGSGGNNGRYKRQVLKLASSSPSQNFYYNWMLDSLNVSPGDKINYYLQVWDNDGVNGSKSTKSSHFTISLPSEKELKEKSSELDKKTENNISKALESTKDLKGEINSLKEDLKVKKKDNWQDQKKLEELLEKKNKLEEEIKKLQEDNSLQNLQKEKFLKTDEKIMEKLKELEKLMNNLLDEETKKLYDELQKLLKEQNKEQLPDLLERINKKELNLEKELERALEMFRKMEFEQKFNNTLEGLKELQKKQEELSKETSQKNVDKDSVLNKQKELSEEFKEKEKDLEELQKLNQELEESSPWQETEQDENEIKENQEKSLQEMKNEKMKKSSESQSKAAEQMKKMAEKLENMQNSMEMEGQEENINNLREILENLLTLSFDQESLMKEFKNVNQSDPRYVSLSQKQLKIKDDAKIIEDSLLSLAKRVFQIESFITREVSEMNNHIEESLDNLKKRKPGIAASKQQFAMKSMNDLALLLNDVLKQMQEQMANSSGKGKKSKGKKKSETPSLGQLQKELNEKINQLMRSGKTGRELSEELAELASQQEMIREALQKMNKALGEKPGSGNLQSLLKEMEKTEEELVNKKLGSKTIERQKDILTRLLDSEKATRERDQEEKREATSAKQLNKKYQDKYTEYLKLKEKEVEFIKTLPPSLNSYYKNQVNNYFKNIKN